jgi:hypothetical protein
LTHSKGLVQFLGETAMHKMRVRYPHYEILEMEEK